VALLVALAVVAQTGCRWTRRITGVPEPPRPGGTITFALPEEPKTLNGMVQGGELMVTRVIINQMRWGLLAVTPGYGYEPRLAESVPTVANGLVRVPSRDAGFGLSASPLTVIFNIKQEARWSDGVPVTAKDVIFTWKTVMNKKTKALWRRGYDQIKSIEASGAKTVVIQFKKPYAGYLDLFSSPSYAYVLPAHALAGKSFNSAETSGPAVSSGPFVLESWKPGQAIVLARNQKFWGTSAWADRIVFKPTLDERSAEQLFMAGSADAYAPYLQTGVADKEVIKRLRGLPEVSVSVAPSGLFVEHLLLNMKSAALRPLGARQAVMGALDRQALAREALGEDGKVATGVSPPATGTAVSDPWEAVQAPAAGSYKPGELTLVSPEPDRVDEDAPRARMLSTVADQLDKAGFRTTTSLMEGGQLFLEVLPKGRFELCNVSFMWQPTADLTHLFGSKQGFPTGQNYTGYASKEADALLATLDTAADVQDRAKVLADLEKLLAHDLPVIPLYHRATVLATRPNVHPGPVNPTIEGAPGDMGQWWVGR